MPNTRWWAGTVWPSNCDRRAWTTTFFIDGRNRFNSSATAVSSRSPQPGANWQKIPAVWTIDATRHVSHNSEESVGQWMFVSTTVVFVRIVAVAIVCCAAACRASNSLTRRSAPPSPEATTPRWRGPPRPAAASPR
jgi:hypothetical protein